MIQEARRAILDHVDRNVIYYKQNFTSIITLGFLYYNYYYIIQFITITITWVSIRISISFATIAILFIAI